MENRFNGIFFVEDSANFDGELKSICLHNNINIEYEIDFEKLLSKILSYRPELLILSLKDYRVNSKFLQIFKEGSPFNIPFVLIIGAINPDFGLNLPNNYFYVKTENFEKYLKEITFKLIENKQKMQILQNVRTNFNEQIYSTLVDLGLNASTNGTNFIKECINEIMLNNCKPSIFSNSLYEQVAFNYKTTPASVARCMKVAIDSAWKKKDKVASKPHSIVSLDEFIHCPTAKEFIYFVANKLYSYNREQNVKKLAVENSR